MRSENPICAPRRVSDSPQCHSALKQFQRSSDCCLLFLDLSRYIVERFLFRSLSPPGHRRCDVLGFLSVGSVSSSSILQIFRDAGHLWWRLCLSFCPIGLFSRLWHAQGSISTGVFEGGCRPLTLTRGSQTAYQLITFNQSERYK